MKKILLVVFVLLLAVCPAIALSACSGVSQAQLLSTSYVCNRGGYELFTYDVYYKTDVVGEMTLKFEPLAGVPVSVPDKTEASGERAFSSFSGTLLSMDLQMDGVYNSDSITSRVLYTNGFTPVYSYKKTNIGGVMKEMQVSYSSKYARTKLFVGGKEENSSRQKIKGATAFDNEMIYAIVRATKVGESSYSLSFSSPNALTASLESITVSKAGSAETKIQALEPKEEESAAAGSEETIEAPIEDATDATDSHDHGVPSYLFRITTGNRYASSYSMAIAKDDLTVHNEAIDVEGVKKVILKIVEGDYSYILKGITIA